MFTYLAAIEAREAREQFPEVAVPLIAARLKKEYAAELAKGKAA
jgi:hypothetical protein